MSLKIYKTDYKIYHKNATNLPRYLQIWLLIILLLVRVYLKYLYVKNESRYKEINAIEQKSLM